jgi:hypothetical protein
MPRKVFVSGEILTASDVNTNLMDQAVMVFDDSAARGSAIPTPSEGMVTYLKDTNQVQAYDGSAFTPVGTILQVVSTTKTDTFSASIAAGAWADVTGLSATITPSSSSSKIFISYSLHGARDDDRPIVASRIERGGTAIGVPATAGNRVLATGASQILASSAASMVLVSASYLDSPASTSPVVYNIAVNPLSTVAAETIYVNRTIDDTDASNHIRSVSTITVMEVAG